jgi:Lhr-like helicase
MEKYSTGVNKEIALAEAKAHHQDRQLQTIAQKKSSKSQKLKRMFAQDNDRSALMARLQSEVDMRRAMERRQQLLDFLSTHDYVTPLKQSRRKRYNGTLDWLFKTREFDRWINDSESPLLWCSGKSKSPSRCNRGNIFSDCAYSWLWQDNSHVSCPMQACVDLWVDSNSML